MSAEPLPPALVAALAVLSGGADTRGAEMSLGVAVVTGPVVFAGMGVVIEICETPPTKPRARVSQRVEESSCVRARKIKADGSECVLAQRQSHFNDVLDIRSRRTRRGSRCCC